MSKRHVAFIKPEEPSFLKKLKKEAGYQEGPTVDTKREDYGEVSREDLEEKDDELPTVVVLKHGDLTAEEAKIEEDRLKKEIEEAPADLSARIVFKAPKKEKSGEKSKDEKKAKKKIKNTKLLSFEEDEDDDN